MECSICYIKSNEEENHRINATFVTLPCEGMQKHVLCFRCFIMNHATSHGKCPVCRNNYMEFVAETYDIGLEQSDALIFADNLSSQIDETEIIMRMHDMVVNDVATIPNQEEINIIADTFEEFASYLLENCEYEL
jgi:hypothetical protein